MNLSQRESELFDLLIDLANQSRGEVTASNKDLLEVLNLNERTLYRTMKRLEDRELIQRDTVSIGHHGKQRIIRIV